MVVDEANSAGTVPDRLLPCSSLQANTSIHAELSRMHTVAGLSEDGRSQFPPYGQTANLRRDRARDGLLRQVSAARCSKGQEAERGVARSGSAERLTGDSSRSRGQSRWVSSQTLRRLHSLCAEVGAAQSEERWQEVVCTAGTAHMVFCPHAEPGEVSAQMHARSHSVP